MSSYRTLTQYAPVAPAGTPAAFQLADLMRLIEARRALILKVTLATIAAAILVALLLPTVWSSTAVVMLDGRKNNVTDLTAVLSQLPSDPATVQNQIQILTSRDLAAKVVQQLGLNNDPEFNAALAPPSLLSLLSPHTWFEDPAPPDAARQQDAVLDAFQKHVTADAIGVSTSISVTAKAQDPGKAARIANALVRAYVGDQVDIKLNAAQNTVQWLGMRVNDLAEQLQLQDAAIQRYKAQHNLNDSGPGNSLADQAMSGINAQIVQAKSDLAEKQAELDRVGALQRSGNAADLSNVVSSPLIAQLRTQEASLLQQESDLATKYGPLHPKMQAVEAQKRDLENKIGQEVGRIAGTTANDVAVAKTHLDSLNASLTGAEREAAGQNMWRVQLAAMESNATSTRTMYEAFVQRLRQAQDQDAVQAPESRIISLAAIPTAPSAPKRSLIVAASLPLGLLLGLLVALAFEKLGYPAPLRVIPRAALIPPVAKAPPQKPPRYKARPAPKPEPVRALWTGPPILAQIAGANALRAADYVIDLPGSRFTHGINALVHQLDSRKDGAAIVAVTSAFAGEGKSALAVALARAAARMDKKAVLIDCDPARLSSRAMAAPVKTGLYDVLTGAVPLNQSLAKDPRSAAYLLGMPRRPANAATMFTSQAMAKLVAVLRGGADLIILDCAPAPAGPEAALIARHADATVLAVRQSALQTAAVANATRILEGAQAAPIGIVVLS